MLRKNLLLLAVGIFLIAGNGYAMYQCGLLGCDFKGPRHKVGPHRFTHTNQRPYQCSGCLHQGPKENIIRHLQTTGCHGASCEPTPMSEVTCAIVKLPILPVGSLPLIANGSAPAAMVVTCLSKTAVPLYRCGVRKCEVREHTLKDLHRHRIKSHLKQLLYHCSVCKADYDRESGIQHIQECADRNHQVAALVKNCLSPESISALNKHPSKMRPNYHYTRLTNWNFQEDVSDESSVECLPDSDSEQMTDSEPSLYE